MRNGGERWDEILGRHKRGTEAVLGQGGKEQADGVKKMNIYQKVPCDGSMNVADSHPYDSDGSMQTKAEALACRTSRAASLDSPTSADPSRTADDEQDDEMSEPTQTTTAEKRKVNEAAKELWALLSITASAHVGS